jgi:hypothetical protein
MPTALVAPGAGGMAGIIPQCPGFRFPASGLDIAQRKEQEAVQFWSAGFLRELCGISLRPLRSKALDRRAREVLAKDAKKNRTTSKEHHFIDMCIT